MVGIGVEVVVPFRVFHVLLVTQFTVEHATHLSCGVSYLLLLVHLCLCVWGGGGGGGGGRGENSVSHHTTAQKSHANSVTQTDREKI